MLTPWDYIITVDLANRSSLFEGLDTELNKRVQFENAFVQNRKWEQLEAQIKNMNLARSSVCYFAKTSEEKRSRYRALQAGLGKEIENINKDVRSMEKDIRVLLDCKKIVETRLENNGEFKVYLERVVKESSKNFKSPTDVVKQAQSYLTIRESLLGNISELHEAISEGKRRLAWIDCWKMLVNTRLSNEMSHAWTRHGELTQGLARIETYFADASEKHKGKSTLLARIEACVANIHRLLVDQLKIVSDPVKSVTLATQLEEMPKLLAELKKMAVVMRSDYIGESDEGFQGPSTVSESH